MYCLKTMVGMGEGGGGMGGGMVGIGGEIQHFILRHVFVHVVASLFPRNLQDIRFF